GRLQSQDSGKHLHDVEDLLQTHNLVEADTSAQAERIKAVQASAQRFTSDGQSEFIHTHTHTHTHTYTYTHTHTHTHTHTQTHRHAPQTQAHTHTHKHTNTHTHTHTHTQTHTHTRTHKHTHTHKPTDGPFDPNPPLGPGSP